MRILVIGSGGREHTLVWKLKQSPKVKKIYCASGNGGICEIADCVDIKAEDIPSLLEFAKKEEIDLTVVGPESPLVAGIVDVFEKEGLKIFGPTKKAAQLEGSKVFSKDFLKRHDIPTADFKSFEKIEDARKFIDEKGLPVVIKADGLAAGKGVFVCHSSEEAHSALTDIMEKKVFKEAGNKVIIEECLSGEEASIIVISDGDNFKIFESAQDHKPIFDGDVGPNTGGMGAYSPAPVVSEEYLKIITSQIVEPTIRGMRLERNTFRGILYAGLMITNQGPYVLEFNVRFGDPETQAVLPRLKTDLVDIILASLDGTLGSLKLKWDDQACVCVVMSSRGYPGAYEKGKKIPSLDSAAVDSDTVIFHAGTKKQDGQIVTNGGRVLGITSLGQDIEQAIEKAYRSIEKIKFDGCFFRRDIGQKALNRVHI